MLEGVVTIADKCVDANSYDTMNRFPDLVAHILNND